MITSDVGGRLERQVQGEPKKSLRGFWLCWQVKRAIQIQNWLFFQYSVALQRAYNPVEGYTYIKSAILDNRLNSAIKNVER